MIFCMAVIMLLSPKEINAAIGPVVPPQITEAPGVTQKVDYFNKSNYFEKLSENKIINYEGECSYISLSMFLSYYDTFLNDDIIPEHYENSVSITSGADLNATNFESPGLKKNVASYMGLGYETMEAYALAEKNNNYLPFIAYHHGTNNGYNVSPSGQNYQATLDSMFFDTDFSFDVSYYENWPTDTSPHGEVIKSQMVPYLNAGYILILELEVYGYGLHSVVVYKFENNCFYMHNGNYEPRPGDIIPYNDTFYYFDAFSAISVNAPDNTHCDNYKINNIGYCGDGTHYHDYTYTQYNASKHVRRCYCGLVEFAIHQVEGTSNNRFQKCIFCNALVDTYNTGVNSMVPPILTLGIRYN